MTKHCWKPVLKYFIIFHFWRLTWTLLWNISQNFLASQLKDTILNYFFLWPRGSPKRLSISYCLLVLSQYHAAIVKSVWDPLDCNILVGCVPRIGAMGMCVIWEKNCTATPSWSESPAELQLQHLATTIRCWWEKLIDQRICTDFGPIKN